jgi:hypothetical protein
MSNEFERRVQSSPEFDLSPGKKYTEEDFERMAAGPDEVLITGKKIELLDAAERAGKEVKVMLITGREVTGRLEGTALAKDYNCGKDHFSADDAQTIEIL